MLVLNRKICRKCFLETQRRFIIKREAEHYFDDTWKKTKLPACCFSQPNNAYLTEVICDNRIPRDCPYFLEQTVNLK
jgi:hypothetical protein